MLANDGGHNKYRCCRSYSAIAIACSPSAVPAQTGEHLAQDVCPGLGIHIGRAYHEDPFAAARFYSCSDTLTATLHEPSTTMNSKEILPQSAALTSNDNPFTTATAPISLMPACAGCSNDPLIQFLMVQIDQMTKRLDKVESTLPQARTHAEAGEDSTCAESVADNVIEEACRWEAMKAEMKKRQQAESYLLEESRQVREELKQLVLFPAPVIDGFSDMHPMNSLPGYTEDGTTKRKVSKDTMKSLRQGLRVAMKICSIVLMVAGIVALSRLPGQAGGLMRLMERKQNDRGMGIYIRW
jgi:hypothetical protein